MNFSRRTGMKILGAAAGARLLPRLHAKGSDVQHDTGVRKWNRDWNFQLGDPAQSGTELRMLSEEAWQRVDLPHCGVEQKYDISASFQGLCWYRKLFSPDASMRGRRVVLEFEGAMQRANVWIDTRHALLHDGGYLPFFLDLTEAAEQAHPATITSLLDNRDNPVIPPGKPQSELDFCYFPGLYRNVRLHVSDKLHLTDAVETNRPAGGGVFVRYEQVSAESATVLVQAQVANHHAERRECCIAAWLRDAGGNEIGFFRSSPQPISAGDDHTFAGEIVVPRPQLWSTRDPYLHTLVIQVMEAGQVIDERSLRAGIRTLRADPQRGFFLNGEHLVPNGANRHQAYPYVGNALSDQAQYRDARLLKEAGFELIRLSHYPQATAFMDACDELGLLTIQCILGWQFFGPGEAFKENVRQNLRDLIRRDRNHACAILWECSLNETGGHDEFVRELVELAHAEYPGDQMLTCGDTEGHKYDDIRYEVPYSGWDDASETRPNRAHGIMSLHREYGDNQFGGYSRYSRGDGEALMLVQAWNYQTSLNQQLALSYTWGQCMWEAIDNCRGGAPEIATCGALDQFRLSKFLYAFFQSQRDPLLVSEHYDSGPMIFIANYWTPQSPHGLVVFCNCDEVELILNGRVVGRRRPDSGPDVKFGDNSGFDLNYWLTNSGTPRDVRKREVRSPVYNGGNCRMLPHPPFTFTGIGFEPGELRATGFLGGRPAVTAMRRTLGVASCLRLRAAFGGKRLVGDGSDLIVIHAEICDEVGTIVPTSSHAVHFQTDGPARLVGDNPRPAEAGIASVLLRSTGGLRRIAIRASVSGLRDAELIISPTTESSPSLLATQ